MKRIILIFSFVFSLQSCEKNEEFAYDINDLIGTEWGYPEIEEGSANHVGPAPIVFYEDGRVTFGGTRSDFWQVRDSRSLLIQQRSQIWIVLQLTQDKLAVEKLRYPNGEFLVRCIYYPIEEE